MRNSRQFQQLRSDFLLWNFEKSADLREHRAFRIGHHTVAFRSLKGLGEGRDANPAHVGIGYAKLPYLEEQAILGRLVERARFAGLQ